MSVLSGTYMDTFDVSCSEINKLKKSLAQDKQLHHHML